MSDSPPIRVGLIGHGLAGAILHAPLIEAVDAFRISAVATSRPDLSARRHAPRRTDAAGVVGADDVDLVVIATPNDSHFPIARDALLAGKHVVVDKPFTLSSAEADALIALAAERRRLLTVFHNRRLDGDFRAVRNAITTGELGRIALFEARWDRFRPDAPAGWRNAATPGAGLLWDLGPHLIDQALLLFGAPDALTADIARQRDGAVADDYFDLTLRYGEMRCILSAASVVAAPRPRFAVHGTTGSLLIAGLDPYEAALRAGHAPGHPDFMSHLPPIAVTRTDAAGSRIDHVPAGDWTAFYCDVARAIRTGTAPAVTAGQARDVVALIERAFDRAPAA